MEHIKDRLSDHPDADIESLTTRRPSLMLILLCIYMFLYIESPWEIWPIFASYRIERVYMLFVLFCFFFCTNKKFTNSMQHVWIFAFLSLHFIAAPFAYSPQDSLNTGFEYSKKVVLYILIVSCVRNRQDLRLLLYSYIFAMFLYMLHSYREFLCGRHVYRMGISRMVGVDDSDPNAFAASIVLSLPFLKALWVTEVKANIITFKLAYLAFVILSAMCVVLTGSRGGFLSICCLFFLWLLNAKNKKTYFTFLVVIGVSFWMLMPVEKRNRIETIWNPEAGPANAQESTEGRIYGLEAGLEMLKVSPLFGIGPGKDNFIRYRVEVLGGIPEQAHILIGQLLGGYGLVGAIVFAAIVFTAWRNGRKVEHWFYSQPGRVDPFLFSISVACRHALVLLLFSGLSGHNLYRPMWLWIAAWTMLVLRFSQEERLKLLSDNSWSTGNEVSASITC